AGSQTALSRALEIPAARVTVISVAPRIAIESLRTALAVGAHDAVLLETAELADDIHGTARLIADHISLQQMPCDLVLCADSIMGATLAGNLGFNHAAVDDFSMSESRLILRLQKPTATITKDGPAVLAVAPGESLRKFTVDEYFSAW